MGAQCCRSDDSEEPGVYVDTVLLDLEPVMSPQSRPPLDDVPAIRAWVKHHRNVRTQYSGGANENVEGYYFEQSFALVRHADRLDHTPEWQDSSARDQWPNDTPLTAFGHERATAVGKALKGSGKQFQLIISSPYLRCAQTASRIAEVLGIPVHFDLDLGEVFDNESFQGAVDGGPQHRDPKTLKEHLVAEFPGVTYVKDAKDALLIEGQLQPWPEPFAQARMRFGYKVKKLVESGCTELLSIVIVSHGDSVAAVLQLLREYWLVSDVPYGGYALATRTVKVLDGKSGGIVHQAVYTNPAQWTIMLSKGLSYKEVRKLADKDSMHTKHDKAIKAVEEMESKILTEYELEYHQDKQCKDCLQRLQASNDEIDLILPRRKSLMEGDRVKCAPAPGE